MKFLDEYRDGPTAKKYARMISELTTRDWTIMEICGGQTHAIVKFGIDTLLPNKITLVHGPGCPVCVTPVETIDRAVAIAARRDVIFTSFGDMLRVPGSNKDLLTIKSEGGDVRIVYSPLDALRIARQNPAKSVVFFAVGFETTAPANAMAVWQAKQHAIKNFSILSSHVLVPPAIEAILSAPSNRVQAFLAAGHVCAVTGFESYFPIARKYRTPIVVTGFEPVDILQGLYLAVKQLEEGRVDVENQYSRAVRREGNREAMELIGKVFEVSDRKWRGIGTIPHSGWTLRADFARHDAEKIYEVEKIETKESVVCISGEIMRGMKKPQDCPAFGAECKPEKPLGAPMVSSEGACAAYYHYGRIKL